MISLTRTRILEFCALIVVGLLVAGTFSVFRSSQPDDQLLGTWTLESRTDGGTTNPPPSDNVTYLGFTDQSLGHILRTYLGTSDATSSLMSVNHWSLAKHPNDSVLEVFFYSDDPSSASTTPFESYLVDLAPETLTLTERYDDGSTGTVYRYRRIRGAAEEAKKDFTRSSAENESICAGVLSGESTSDILLPIACPFEMGKEAGKATLRVNERGDLTIDRNGAIIFSMPFNFASGETPSDFLAIGSGPFLSPRGLALEDITYD